MFEAQGAILSVCYNPSHIEPQCLLYYLFVDQSWDLLFDLDLLRIFFVHLCLSFIDLRSHCNTFLVSHFYLVGRYHHWSLTNVGHTQHQCVLLIMDSLYFWQWGASLGVKIRIRSMWRIYSTAKEKRYLTNHRTRSNSRKECRCYIEIDRSAPLLLPLKAEGFPKNPMFVWWVSDPKAVLVSYSSKSMLHS